MQMRYCKTKCWAYLIFRKVFGTPGNGFRSPPLISFASRSLLSKVEKGERCLRSHGYLWKIIVLGWARLFHSASGLREKERLLKRKKEKDHAYKQNDYLKKGQILFLSLLVFLFQFLNYVLHSSYCIFIYAEKISLLKVKCFLFCSLLLIFITLVLYHYLNLTFTNKNKVVQKERKVEEKK